MKDAKRATLPQDEEDHPAPIWGLAVAAHEARLFHERLTYIRSKDWREVEHDDAAYVIASERCIYAPFRRRTKLSYAGLIVRGPHGREYKEEAA